MESQPLYPPELKQVCDNEMWWHFFSFHALTSVLCLSPWFYQASLTDYSKIIWWFQSTSEWGLQGLSKTRQDGISNGMAFFARNLQYLETPQYLRKQLVPVHKAGLASLWICGWEIEVAVLLIEMKGNRSRVEGLIFDKGGLWIHLWSDFIMSSTWKFLSQKLPTQICSPFSKPCHCWCWGFEMGGSIGSLGCTTSPAQERAFAIPGRCCMGTFLSRDSCLCVSGLSSCLLT